MTSGSITVSGAVTITSGSVTVSGTVSISGSVTITGTVSISGSVTITGAVTVTSGAIHIATSAGTNIIVDLLTSTAYTERRTNIQNPALANPSTFLTSAYRAKFFPRGCRGYLYEIKIRARNTTGGDLDLDFAIAPYIGAGEVLTFSITVTAGEDGTSTLTATIKKMWNYDGMFIYCKTENTATLGIGYITGGVYDAHYGYDLITWTASTFRLYIMAVMKGQTISDIPVTGTINTINLPNETSQVVSGTIEVAHNTETTLLTVNGSGHSLYLFFRVQHDDCECRIYVDDTLVANWIPAQMNGYGFTATTCSVALLKYGADASENIVWITLKYEFLRKFELKGFQQTGGAIEMLASAVTSLIR